MAVAQIVYLLNDKAVRRLSLSSKAVFRFAYHITVHYAETAWSMELS